jgi:antitoxin component of MazEF toxin-antitoxin module
MRALQKLAKNGNSTCVSIPRPILIHLGWLPGEPIIVELLEDDSLRLRRPVMQDIAPISAPRMLPAQPAPAAK